MDKQSIAIGSSKGFPVTKRTQKQRPSHRKGAVENAKGSGNKVVRRKVNFVRELIREVTGLAPYEKRVVGAFLVSASNPLFLVMTVHFCRVVEARQGEACFEGCQAPRKFPFPLERFHSTCFLLCGLFCFANSINYWLSHVIC